MLKIIVSVEKMTAMEAVHSYLIAETERLGTTAKLTPDKAEQLGFEFEILELMRSRGAIYYCSLTGTYNLHPSLPRPISDFFKTALS